jgi:hypothetical protein
MIQQAPDTLRGYAPKSSRSPISAASPLLISCYLSSIPHGARQWPSGIASTTGWRRRITRAMRSAAAYRRSIRSCGPLEGQIASISNYGPAGAIVKLTVLQMMTRSCSDDTAHTVASETIALLARSAGLEPYDYGEAARA